MSKSATCNPFHTLAKSVVCRPFCAIGKSARRSPTVSYVKGDFCSAFKLQPEKVIAEGMFGQIVLAIPTKKKHTRRVVKKFCLLNEEKSARSRRHFDTEVMVMQSFDHPYIMKCLIAGECPEYLAISMHHYQRGTLRRYMVGLSIQLSELYITQIACALQYMHKHHVVHLDVKLDNIFMDNEFNVILGDFGLAVKLFPEQEVLSINNCGGSCGYLAPERIGTSASKLLDPYKLDSFSLGVVLWSMVVSKMPAVNIDYHLDVTKRQGLPVRIRSWLLNLLERNPSKRLTVTDMLSMIRRESPFRNIIDKF